MVVLDSSALVPLSHVGRLDLVRDVYGSVATTDAVVTETVEEGRGHPGASAIAEFLEPASVHETPENAETVAEAEGIAVADASIVLVAQREEAVLLANDKPLVRVARARGVECDWVTTLVLRGVEREELTSEGGKELLHDLVTAGMNLSPQVYATVRRRLDDL